jgi:NADPH-dependent 2,4-dienoyl-CoA reductase/sulfur reductase-like enzyme
MPSPTAAAGQAGPCKAMRPRHRGAARARPRAVVTARAETAADGSSPRRPKVVVVGGGWAGFGAAKHLAEQVRQNAAVCRWSRAWRDG